MTTTGSPQSKPPPASSYAGVLFQHAGRTEDDGPGQLEEPYGVAVDGRNLVYVTDFDEHRIQVLDRNGKVLARIGNGGKDPGEFDQPTGIAIDGAGNVYVCDTDNNRIQKFTPA